jgi:Zn-dependent peptidase ImmA (M78 family)
MSFLSKPLEYFTDPFIITQKNIFSWRIASSGEITGEDEDKAKKLIASYCEFSKMLKSPPLPLSMTLRINKTSTYDEIEAIAEQLAKKWELGKCPVNKLQDIIETELNIPVLYIDAPENISGAACRLDNFHCILINRNEPIGRQSFDLAHELFHLLTWDVFKPKPIDEAGKEPKSKEEKLADKFASVILMPRESITRYWKTLDNKLELLPKLKNVAAEYRVSVAAAYWRLFNLNLVPNKENIDADYDSEIKFCFVEYSSKPQLFSYFFAKLIKGVLDKGLASRGKVESLLGCKERDLENLFIAHGLKGLYEL